MGALILDFPYLEENLGFSSCNTRVVAPDNRDSHPIIHASPPWATGKQYKRIKFFSYPSTKTKDFIALALVSFYKGSGRVGKPSLFSNGKGLSKNSLGLRQLAGKVVFLEFGKPPAHEQPAPEPG